MFEYQITSGDGFTLVKLKGRIDGITAPNLEKLLDELVVDGSRIIVVNFREITYISSIGLRVFLIIQKKLRKIEGEIIIQQPEPMILDIIKSAGFDKIIKITFQQEVDLQKSTDSQLNSRLYKNFRVTSVSNIVERGKLRVIGDISKMKTADYSLADVKEVSPASMRYGFGLAALGADFEQYKQYFGETLVINKDILVYPALEKSAVDVMLAGTETYKFLNGVAFDGEFSQLHLLEAEDGYIPVDSLVEFINFSSDSAYKGVVFLGESKGFWGMNLRKVPVASYTDNIFSRDTIMQWLNFPIGATDYNSLILGVGVITSAKEKDQQIFNADNDFHIHAAVIQNEALNKSIPSFMDEWRRLLLEAEIKKVQHLMTKTQFNSILLGIIDLDISEQE